jgi:hypothetical protein
MKHSREISPQTETGAAIISVNSSIASKFNNPDEMSKYKNNAGIIPIQRGGPKQGDLIEPRKKVFSVGNSPLTSPIVTPRAEETTKTIPRASIKLQSKAATSGQVP